MEEYVKTLEKLQEIYLEIYNPNGGYDREHLLEVLELMKKAAEKAVPAIERRIEHVKSHKFFEVE